MELQQLTHRDHSYFRTLQIVESLPLRCYIVSSSPIDVNQQV